MNEELYKKYDKIVSYLLGEMMLSTEEDKALGFEDFNPKSREHLAILYIAKYAAALSGRKLGLNINYYEFLKIKAKHKTLRGIIIPKAEANINIAKLLGKLFMELPEADVLTGGLGVIYTAYYEPGKEIE